MTDAIAMNIEWAVHIIWIKPPPNTGLGGGFKTEEKVARLIVGRTKGFSRIPKNVAKDYNLPFVK